MEETEDCRQCITSEQTDDDLLIIGHKSVALVNPIDPIEDNESIKNSIPIDKSYVQLLNEMFPNGTSYVEEGRTGPHHKPLFRIGVHVCGLTFHGLSQTKQKARHEAARAAISYFRSDGQRTDTSLYDRRHQFDYRNDNYHRYQPYYPFDNRWHRPDPYDSYDPYISVNPNNIYDHFYEPHNPNIGYRQRPPHRPPYRPSDRPPESTPLYYRERGAIPIDCRPEAPAVEKVVIEGTNVSSSSIAVPLIQQSGSQRKSDFTVDEYNDDSFVEFNEKLENREDREDKEDNCQAIGDQTSQQLSKPKKERIILRVMSETPVNQNPVSVIHELQPNAKWVCTELNTRRHSTTFEMRLLLPLANQCFTGTARTKKLAKAEAAAKALLQLYNISLNPEKGDCPDSFKPMSTVQIAQEPLLLKEDIANRVGAAVMSKCNQVWDQLTDLKKWTVLSAIVLTDETNVDLVDVICMTSGTKCVKGDSLSMSGYALNDCHAEVLARRSFLRYIYCQIEKLIDNSFEDNPDFILEIRPDGQGFRIKSNIKVNLFISTAPCGDSRVFSPKEEKEGDAHPNRQTRGLLRAKIEGGEGTIPVKRDSIQTWDGVLQGHQRLQFMSCSDKIAVWNVVGIQGALLSHLMEPIYLSSVVLASLFNYEHLVRAIHGRLHLNFDSNSLNRLPQPFVLNKCKVAKCQLKDDLTRQLTKAPNYALNWIKGDDSPEVVSTESGRIHTENTISRLAKRSLFGRFSALLGRNSPVLPNCTLKQHIPIIYRDGKTASLDYQRAKTQCMQTFQEQNLGNWIQVPAETDLFRL